MPEPMKFFSQEWCDGALEAADNEAVYKGFKDAPSFTHVLEFECTDREGLSSQVEYVAGKPVAWTQQKFDDDQVFARFRGTVETFRLATEGKKTGAQLLMAGKIKLVKGSMQTAIENANAFNAFLVSWGQVPTDWEP